MMREVVCRGTAKQARVPGLSIAGKTGTGYIAQPDGGYDRPDGTKAYYASFVGFLPGRGPAGDDPRVDRPAAAPDSDDRFGGTAAAPVFRELAPTMIHELGIEPPPGSTGCAGVTDVRAAPAPRRSTPLGALARRRAGRLHAAPSSAMPATRGDGDDPRLPRSSQAGDLFACVRGEHVDGHDFAGRGRRGRAPRRCSSTTSSTSDVAQLVVDDTRRALGPIAAAVHDHPSRDLHVVGITGTNGKTTTTHLLASILRAAGRPTGVIGTLSGHAHDAGGARAAGPPGRRSAPPATGPS